MAAPNGADPRPQAGGVVVGVDGSPGSLAALRWAVREASERGQTVQAVIAWHFPVPSPVGNVATVDERHPVIAAEEILASALVEAGVADDNAMVTTTPVEGHPAEVLMQLAERADLLVVGSRGHGRIFGALLGSISQYVASRAACPVVVITPDAVAGRRSRARR
ncbi:MAG: universal stress protein [Pseudonocardia sp.]|nr:universal stress protein [Pseudonocardia sp.]